MNYTYRIFPILFAFLACDFALAQSDVEYRNAIKPVESVETVDENSSPSTENQQSVGSGMEAGGDNHLIAIKTFAQDRQIGSVEISPDGTHIAFVQMIEDDGHLVVARVEGDEFIKTFEMAGGEEGSFNWLEWASNDRLVLSVRVENGLRIGRRFKIATRRLVAVNKDGSNPIMLLQGERRVKWIRRRFDDVISFLPDDPDHILIGFSDEGDHQSNVYKLNINNGEKELILEPEDDHYINDWYANWKGDIKYGYGYDDDDNRLMLINRKSGEWYPLHDHELFEDRRFRMLGFSYDDDQIYVMSSHITGRDALYKFDLEKGELAGKVFDHDEVDVSGIIKSDVRKKIVAAYYIDDNLSYEYLDDEYKALRGSIDAALPNRYNNIVSLTDDEHFAIILSTSPDDPGSYYIFYNEPDKPKRLLQFGFPYPGIMPENLSPMKRVTYESRDTLNIPAYITTPAHAGDEPLPAIIMPHGGPWARDYLTYDLWAQFLANRGYIVLQPNFRGSTGYGSRYEALGYGAWGRSMQDDITDGTRWLIENENVDPDRICIVGGSYGGYASLMGVIRQPELYKCAAAFAPATDIKMLLKEWGDYDEDNWDYYRVAGTLDKKEITRFSPIKRVEEINRPVLLVHGTDDGRVDFDHSKKLAKKLKKEGKEHKFVELEESSQFLSDPWERHTWLRELEMFLAQHIGSEQQKAWAAASEPLIKDKDAKKKK